MKINPQRPAEGQDVYLRVQRPEGKEAPDKAKKTELQKNAQDKVQLSERAKKVEQLTKAVEAVPDVRLDRVQALKKAIQEGTYRVDPEKIAQKMIEEI